MRGSALLSLACSLPALATASCGWTTGGGRAAPAVTLEPIVASPPPAEAPAQRQLERGASLYARECGRCHDADARLGPPLDAVILAAYLTPRALYDYAATQMPPDRPGTLTPEEYWDALAFLLHAKELLPAGVVLGPANADTLRLRKSFPRRRGSVRDRGILRRSAARVPPFSPPAGPGRCPRIALPFALERFRGRYDRPDARCPGKGQESW